MSKNAIVLTAGNKLAVPEHIARLTEKHGANIEERQTTPTLTYGGKTWTIILNGEKTKLVGRNSDGDEVPLQIMRMVILNYNKDRGRSFYEGAYDPDKPAQPTCWSDDSKVPHASVPKKQAATCASCPRSTKGSKVTETGKQTTECSQHRMLAVVPAHNLNFQPLRLKIAVTSDWDPDNKEASKGYFAFSDFVKTLRANGLMNTAFLSAKVKFDSSTDYPKLLFSTADWLDPADADRMAELAKTDEVLALLKSWTPAGGDGVPVDNGPDASHQEDDEEIARIKAQRSDEARKAREAEAEAEKTKAAKAAAAKAKREKAEAEAAAAAAAAKAAAEDDDDEGMEIIMPGADAKPRTVTDDIRAAQKEDKTAETKPSASSDVNALLADWGADD